jgi:hypothetical protein
MGRRSGAGNRSDGCSDNGGIPKHTLNLKKVVTVFFVKLREDTVGSRSVFVKKLRELVAAHPWYSEHAVHQKSSESLRCQTMVTCGLIATSRTVRNRETRQQIILAAKRNV